MKRVEVFGVPLDDLSEGEFESKIRRFLTGESQHLIVTPNPEMILDANKNPDFKKVLSKASVSLPDGIGVLYAVKALTGKDIRRQTGTDALERIAAQIGDRKMLLIGGELLNVAERAAVTLRTKFPQTDIKGLDPGKVTMEKGRVNVDSDVLETIQDFEPDIIAVGLGQVKQEFFIQKFLPQFPSVKIGIGVGGAFDMISGAIPRAPEWMRRVGLEWLWRLYLEPRRIKRIFRASVIFPLKVYIKVLKKKRFFQAHEGVLRLIFKQFFGKR